MKSDLSGQTSMELMGLDPETVRHTISRALSFMNTAIRNLSGTKPDLPQALKMHSVGDGQLRALLTTLDVKRNASKQNAELLYDGIRENVYTADHPEVISWTHTFHEKVAKKEIFAKFQTECSQPSSERAVVVGVLWHRFSELMPWFLCQAAAQVSSNEKRHYVIQTAFEELGMREASQIHADMFWSAACVAGATVSARERICQEPEPTSALAGLRRELLEISSDAEVLGILLGLEAPAVENIETIFSSLAYKTELASSLEKHKFFRLHRQIEIEHVRLTVSNFLRFCTTREDRELFSAGFDRGLKFWKQFWDATALSVQKELARSPHRA